MTTIDTSNSAAAASTVGRSATTTSRSAAAGLGQQDFLTLMTAQLQNQDPFAPMQNGEFLAQMAQFSTVSGIDKMNDTLSNIGDGMRDFRVATASNLLGNSVLVPGNVARADTDGAIHGVVDLANPADSVVVTYSNSQTGELLHSETYGAQTAGLMGFDWNGLPPSMAANRTPVRIGVTVTSGQQSQQVGPSVFARVLSARTQPGGQDVTLQVEDYGDMNSLEIEAFR